MPVHCDNRNIADDLQYWWGVSQEEDSIKWIVAKWDHFVPSRCLIRQRHVYNMSFHTLYGIVRHKTIILGSFRCVQLHCQTPTSGVCHQHRCSYTLSRFPRKRPVGPGRSREILKPISPSKKDPLQDGSQRIDLPSTKELPVWYASQRPSVSNAEEGLQRLLMQNETLIIERCWNAL